MATTNDLKNGMVLKIDGQLWTVVEFQHVKPGKGPAFVRTKLKNVTSGKSIDKTFNAGVKVETSNVDKRTMQYLYNDGSSFVFMDPDTYDQVAASQNFSSEVDQQRDRVIASAIEQAEGMGATGPMTFPVNTPWRGVYLNDNDNWFYALNGISYNQTGYVTVTPPAEPGGSWTYVWSTEVNIRDRYNWDGTKSTDIGPITVSDEQLAELHRKGLASEYTAVGSSSSQHHTGEVP